MSGRQWNLNVISVEKLHFPSIVSFMRTIKMKYPTQIRQRTINDKLYVMEAIRDLDEAIDLICEAMTPDEQLDPFAEDLCPYFGVLWPAAEGLAQYIGARPELVKNKTVLELGCGLGFPALVATHVGGKVLATDFHPDVEEYFQRNCRHSTIHCEYQRLNWREESSVGQFDVVMGSDVLYESKHPKEVARGLVRYAKPGGKIILSDPGRSYLQQFMNAMNDEGYREEIVTLTIDQKEVFVIEYTV